VSPKLPRRSLVAIAAALLVGTAVGQEPSAVSQGKQTPALSKPQSDASKPGASKAEASTAKTEAPQREPTIESREDKVSYAFGVSLARDLQQQKDDLNVDLLVRALTEALAGRPLIMSYEEATKTLAAFDTERKHDFEHAKTMIRQKNKRLGEAFFGENVKKEGVVTLPSGLQYKILTQGNGKIPTLDDTVLCHYRGSLLDGTEFASSYKRDQPQAFPVKELIPGWSQALQLMPVGSKWQLFIPPQLGYGERVMGPIGPNAMLTYEVELISIQDKPPTVSAQ
jgi:FKBP-type peptidyl-prolyl cis-trans isomerase FklB